MDRFSNTHNLRPNLTNEVNTIHTNPTQDEKSSIIISYKKQKQFPLSKTTFQRPQQAANTYININRSILGNQQTPFTEKKFSEIRTETESIYNALRNFENSAYNYHDKYDKIKNDATGKGKWEKFKSARNDLLNNPDTIDSTINLQNTKAYKNLKHRKQTSLLERHLSGSPLSTKLDPLTGVFRDTKTGLYAQLKSLEDGSGDYALCFGSTGVGRMTMMQIKVDINQVLNQKTVPAAYLQAVELATELIKQTGIFGATIKVTGQSMGGGIANYVGMKLGIESACYNPAALGQAAIKDLKNSGCLTAENLNKQKIIRQSHDIISGEKNQKKIAQLANFFSSKKVATPQHLGPTYVAKKTDIPSLNGVTRGFQFRHFTSSFQPFYDTSNTQAT